MSVGVTYSHPSFLLIFEALEYLSRFLRPDMRRLYLWLRPAINALNRLRMATGGELAGGAEDF